MAHKKIIRAYTIDELVTKKTLAHDTGRELKVQTKYYRIWLNTDDAGEDITYEKYYQGRWRHCNPVGDFL